MDQKLLFFINREWTNPALDRFMAFMSSFPAWLPWLILAALLAMWRGGFRARAFVLCAALFVGVNDGLVAKNLKKLIDRPRPAQVLNDVREVDLAKAPVRFLALARPARVRISHPTENPPSDGRSFPSSHTVNTICVAVLAAAFYPRFGWLAFFPALLVAYSRVYTGSHWPSDVAVSLLLGVGLTLLELASLEWLWRTQGARISPRLCAAHRSLFSV